MALKKIKKIISLTRSTAGRQFLLQRAVFRKECRVPGQLALEEGVALYRLGASPEVQTVVEIGSYKGKSANFIARGLSLTGELHCIDTWQNEGMSEGLCETFDIFKANLPPRKKSQIILHRGFSWDVAKTWNPQKKIDMIFIDGDHAYKAVEADIRDWLPNIKPGGVLAFHDYTHPCGVKRAVNEAVAAGSIVMTGLVTSLCIARKIK